MQNSLVMSRTLSCFVLFAAGCASLSASRVGPTYPANPPACPLQFDDVDQQSAIALTSRYTLVGTIELPSRTKEFAWTDEAKEKAQSEACRLGGDLVVYAGPAFSGSDLLGDSWADLSVYRKR